MAEQSYIFDFNRVDSFFENWNVKYFVDEMWQVDDISNGEYHYANEGSNCFELVLVSHGDDNIENYLDEDGALNDDVVIFDSANCGLDWVNEKFGEGSIELHDAVEFDIGTESATPLKAVILRNGSTGYVMGYSINIVPFTVTNKVVFDEDVVFWTITRFNNG